MSNPSRAASGFLAVGVLVLAAAGGAHVLDSSSHSHATASAQPAAHAQPKARSAAGTTSTASAQPAAHAQPKARSAAGATTFTIPGAAVGRAVPAGFLGLSMDPESLGTYGGTDPKAPNPVFEQLLRDVSIGQQASLRIGGDGTDWSWYPVPGMARPLGVRYTLTRSWFGVARSVAQATGAKLILGIDLEADSRRLSAAEGKAMLSNIGRQWIEGFEIGNEPELYGSFSWYKAANGQHVTGRPRGYDFTDYLRDFSSIAGSVPRGVPLAGPSTGAPKWIPELGRFLAAEPRVGVATLHRYPLKHCGGGEPVTLGQLLSNSSSHGLADGVARYVGVAHSHHAVLRLDEINGISCGGVRGISDTFASALWALDTAFELDRVGVDGVNFHTVPNAINELISAGYSHGRWHSFVHPQFYGLVMFAQAAPAGSRLLRVSGTMSGGLHVWATRATNGQIRVVLIDEATRGSRTVAIRIPSARGAATLARLQAPSVRAKSGVTLGGQTFGSSTYTGLLAGKSTASSVAPSGSTYTVTLPAASAALLTLPAG